jgi:Flp pilus assembly protein TadG
MRSRAKLQITKLEGKAPLKRFSAATEGATAIEFALVAVPFFTLIFMLTGFALYFFVTNSLDKGMDTVSRQLRTGQAQKANMTVSGFKTAVCDSAGSWIDCNKATVFVDRPVSWDQVQQRNCFQPSGALVTNPASGTDLIAQYSGTADSITLVTICYQWDFAKKIPFISAFQGINGMTKMQTSTALRIEPYN